MKEIGCRYPHYGYVSSYYARLNCVVLKCLFAYEKYTFPEMVYNHAVEMDVVIFLKMLEDKRNERDAFINKDLGAK